MTGEEQIVLEELAREFHSFRKERLARDKRQTLINGGTALAVVLALVSHLLLTESRVSKLEEARRADTITDARQSDYGERIAVMENKLDIIINYLRQDAARNGQQGFPP